MAAAAPAANGASSGGGPMSQLRTLFRGAGRVAGALFLVSVGTNAYLKWRQFKEYVTLPQEFFLELDLEQQTVVERASPLSLLSLGGPPQLELAALSEQLRAARDDARVRGLLAILGGREAFAGGFAQLQELRGALAEFRLHAQGRAPVYAYSNAFGEGGTNGTAAYYVASAADRVYTSPTGMVSLLGFESTGVFVKGLLDRLDVRPEVFRREEFKNALAPLTNEAYDAPHRENVASLLGSLYAQVVDAVAASRRLRREQVEAAVAAAPLLPAAAVAARLIDGARHRDEVEAALLAQQLPAAQQQHQARMLQVKQARDKAAEGGGGGVAAAAAAAAAYRSVQLKGPRVALARYAAATEWQRQRAAMFTAAGGAGGAAAAAGGVAGMTPVATSGGGPAALASGVRPAVALIHLSGPIMQGGGPTPPGGDASSNTIDSHRVVRVLRALREQPAVRAVVLRVNSGGGSAVASDMIAREVDLLRRAGKPVVACFGDVAASGGYYLAAPATRIVCQPGTITGSIGVIFAKVNVGDALARYGVTSDAVKAGSASADWASPFRPLTPEQRQQVEAQIDKTYGDFLSVVAAGRRMAPDAVRAVAKGRVWSGAQALAHGLVDELGGTRRAVALAKELAGLPAEDEDARAAVVVEWPPRRVPAALLLLRSLAGGGGGGGGGGGDDMAAMAAVAAAAAGSGGGSAGGSGGGGLAGAAAALGAMARLFVVFALSSGGGDVDDAAPSSVGFVGALAQAAAAAVAGSATSPPPLLPALPTGLSRGPPEVAAAWAAALPQLLAARPAGGDGGGGGVQLVSAEAVALSYSC